MPKEKSSEAKTKVASKDEEKETKVVEPEAPPVVVSQIAKTETEADEYKQRWIFAKKAASDNANALKAASKDVKTAQDAQLAAEEQAEEAKKVHEELKEVQARCDAAEAAAATLEKKLQKADQKVAAAEKIAEGLAELK